MMYDDDGKEAERNETQTEKTKRPEASQKNWPGGNGNRPRGDHKQQRKPEKQKKTNTKKTQKKKKKKTNEKKNGKKT